jgi:flavin reductase (DIM6/NTAB) family NADH-FMN oxidoreductase RutF
MDSKKSAEIPRRQDVPFERLVVPVVHAWDRQWLLLACGDFARGDFNCMTVGWGAFGVMWKKPFALVVVRPTRHTRGYMDGADNFTVCAFPEEHRKKLTYCGSHSGRDEDKVKACGLTPIASRLVASPGFDEAELIVECRKMYADDFDPSRFLDPSIQANYPNKDYHRMYFGEIVAVSGTSAYRMSG